MVVLAPNVTAITTLFHVPASVERVPHPKRRMCMECLPRRPRAADRWQQVRARMGRLTRGRRCRMRSRMDDAQTGSVPFRASMLHKDFWLEALDPQHRYGFHLRAFHQAWLDEMDAMRETTCASQDTSFFHWLDYGNGRHVHVPACSQSHLRTTFVHYCSEDERKRYELAFVSHGQNVCVQYAASGRTVHTDERSKWIFVLDLAGRMYLSRKRKGKFHHSSFVSGAPILAAGKIIIKHGVIRAVEPHSGHFKPRLENLLVLCFVLTNHGVDMDGVALVKPKKWTCDWPFPSQPHLELEDFVGASDTDDGVDKSEAEDTQTLLLPAR